MKNYVRSLIIVIAAGAAIQTIYTYAEDNDYYSIKDQELKILQLIEHKQYLDLKSESFANEDIEALNEMPEIKNHEDFKEVFTVQVMKYLKAIKAEDALKRTLNKPQFRTLRVKDGEPGI